MRVAAAPRGGMVDWVDWEQWWRLGMMVEVGSQDQRWLYRDPKPCLRLNNLSLVPNWWKGKRGRVALKRVWYGSGLWMETRGGSGGCVVGGIVLGILSFLLFLL